MQSSPSRPRRPNDIHELVELADGTPLLLRDQTRDDRRLLFDFFDGLSPRSRQLRFLSPIPQVSDRLVDALSAVDGYAHVGVVAVHGARIVGAARYIRDGQDPGAAELAFTVGDDVQRRGLGRLLVASLLEHAAHRGVGRFTADMAGDNYAAHGLLRSFGARLRSGGGETTAVIPVTGVSAAVVEQEAA